MAIGLAASGIGLGILVVVPLNQWMIANFGWRQALFILAGLLIGVIAPANFLLQRQRPEQMGLKPDFGTYEGPVPRGRDHGGSAGAQGITLKQALRTTRFWWFGFGVLFGAIPLHMVLIHQVAAVNDAGYSTEVAAYALGLIGYSPRPRAVHRCWRRHRSLAGRRGV